MNQLAAEINSVLEPTVAGRLLSRFGKEIFFPKGIVAQSAEAGQRAKRFNATIGLAVEHGVPLLLPCIRNQTPGLSESEMVSYAPTGGLPELRQLWLKQLGEKNPDLDLSGCSLPMVVPGLTNGIAQCADLFIDPDDLVIVPDMHWDNYDLIFHTRKNARVLTFPLFSAQGCFNLDGLEKLLADLTSHEKPRKICLVLNFPNNPSGYTPDTGETTRLVNLLKATADKGVDLLVICDDAYFGLFYEPGTSTQSIFTPLSRAHERILAVKVDGSTKEDYSWGFRLGFVTFSSAGLQAIHRDQLLQKLMGSIRSSISNSSMPGQSILLKAYRSPGYQAEKTLAFAKLEERYRKVRAIIDAHPWQPGKGVLQPMPFNSGYFMTFRCHGISSETLRLTLLDRGIGTISLNGIYLRVAYAATDIGQIDELYAEIYQTADEFAGKN